MSQITTHILDTSRGQPAMGVTVSLEQKTRDGWKALARGLTDADGRIKNLLPEGEILTAGEYQLFFETDPYFASQNIVPFFPAVVIQFYIRDTAHYHIPLLLSPFGYTTYRGS